MNGSPSDASLASSKKPSTANSSASNKRSRTIIVARNISDAPFMSSVSAAAERSAVATNLGSSAGRLPGTNIGFDTKLPTYAALGSSDDVGLYQKYLLEQTKGGHRSASELRNGGNASHHSPQLLTASMKRKTISQLNIGDSITSAADTTSSSSGSHHQSTGSLPPRSNDTADTHADTSSASRALMQLEMEQDAKKRRDALVQRRKWLQTLPIHERLAHQRQQNALKHWQQINRDWEHFKTRACKKLGKTEKELVMTRAAKYREQVEMYDALQKARPLSEKVGGDFWLVSLRGDGTRFVPVGNIFSGLFCPIRESTRLGPRVRRPLDYVGAKDLSTTIYEGYEDDQENDDNSHNNTSNPVSLLEKRSLELLARKKRRLRKQLQVLLPHEVDDSASSKLVVDTMDLFEWASRGDGKNNSRGGTPDSSMLSLPLEESAMERAALMNQHLLSARDENNQQQSSPSLQISVLSLENNDNFYEKAQRSSSDNTEPEPLLLSFYGDTSQLLQRSIMLNNDGSTVLHYQWTHEDFSHPSITPHLDEKEPLNNRQEVAHSLKKKTFVSQTQGTILPGEQETFVFSFEAPKPGLFLEKWLLDVDPPARIRFSSVAAPNSNKMANPDGDNGPQQSPRSPTSKVSAYKPVEVHLKCTAVDNFTPTSQHLAQKHEIEKQKTLFMVEQLVEDVLKQVDSKPKVDFPELRNVSEMDQFYNLNCDAFGDVYYSDTLVSKCRELYAQARQVLASYNGVSASGAGTEPDGASGGENNNESAESQRPTSSGILPDLVQATSSAGCSSRVLDRTAGEGTEIMSSSPSLVVVGEGDDWDLSLSTLRAISRKVDALNAAKRKELAKELQKIVKMEEEEEEDEEEDDDEDEDDDDDDEEEEEEEEGDEINTSQKAKPTEKQTVQEKKAARAARRAQILQERLQKRQELEENIALLRPQLQDAFRATYLEAYAAPYDSAALSERLAQKIAHLCSEVPVIRGITRMLQQQQKQSNGDVRVETEKGVAQVLTRAIDEAIAFDMEYQLQYEHERKRLQQVLLGDKLTFNQALPKSGEYPPAWLTKGVLLLHVDLDLAHWFTLVKDSAPSSPSALAETGGASDPPIAVQASEPQELRWQFSPEFLDRDDFVPEKVAKAAQAIKILMQLIQEAGCGGGGSRSKSIRVKAIVLVSDLSSPPVTKPVKKLLMLAVKQKERTERVLLDGIAHQLSFQPISQVLERAMSKGVTSNNGGSSIDFCASVGELTEKLCLLSTAAGEMVSTLSTISEPTDGGGAESVNSFSVKVASPPKLFLMEHLKALAGGGSKISSNSGVIEKPATPASNVPQTQPAPAAAVTVAPPDPKSAAARKKSVAVTAPQTKVTPAAVVAPLPAIPATPPLSEQAATTRAEDKPAASAEASLLPDSTAAERLQAETLGTQLADLCDAFVVDTFLPPPYESVFIPSSYGSGDEEQPEKKHQPVVMLGPSLLKKVEQWAQTLQPPLSLSAEKTPWTTTAIVGGKNLAAKLRLIDNLLEVADRIYFVGDVALSLYRVLFTKHDDKRKKWRKVPPQSPLSLWSILVPAVEKFKQKARRKCVKLLLPVDWIVGETGVEEQDTTISADDDDEDDDDEEEEEDLEDQGEASNKKARKRQLKAKKPKKPILEPDEIDSWRSKPRQWQYDGEKAHVGIDSNGLLLSNSNDPNTATASWISVFEVDVEMFSKFKVLKGKPSILISKSTTTSEDDEDGENDDSDPSDNASSSGKTAGSNTMHENDIKETMDASELDNPTNFEFEWTLRAFDVGPVSMKILLSHLQQTGQASENHQLIVHGLFGVVECRDFDRATREFVSFLEGEWASPLNSQTQTYDEPLALPDSFQSLQQQPEQRERKFLLSGESTLEWVQQLKRTKTKDTQDPLQHPTLVMNQDRKMAHILRDVLSAKPNTMLLRLNPPPLPHGAAQVEGIAEEPSTDEKERK